MHLEVLVEDRSGEALIGLLLEKLLGGNGAVHTWRTHAYRGVGRIPGGLRGVTDPWNRILLDRLPRLLAGYGQSQQGQDAAVVVVLDVDDKPCVEFKRELVGILNRCRPRPKTLFRLAIEETEAWLLGDRKALLAAFPNARQNVLHKYRQDEICGTWEMLAEAIFPGGAQELKQHPYRRIGEEKSKWAAAIGRHMDVDDNRSPSFQAFRRGVRQLCGESPV